LDISLPFFGHAHIHRCAAVEWLAKILQKSRSSDALTVATSRVAPALLITESMKAFHLITGGFAPATKGAQCAGERVGGQIDR